VKRLRSAPGLCRISVGGALFRVGETQDVETLLDIDRDAGTLFEQAGLHLDLPEDHEFPVSERNRWLRSLEAGTTVIAMDPQGQAVGFGAVGLLNGQPYLEQLSVRCSHMRRGIGSALLHAAIDASDDGIAAALWLTTYDHLWWNRPFYGAHGFVRVWDGDCDSGIQRELEFQRRWLPMPGQRIAMRRSFDHSAEARTAIS